MEVFWPDNKVSKVNTSAKLTFCLGEILVVETERIIILEFHRLGIVTITRVSLTQIINYPAPRGVSRNQ